MRFWTRIKQVASTFYGGATEVTGGLWSRLNGWGWGRWRRYLPSARFDWESEAGDTWMNSLVALCISWLGDRFPRPKIGLSKLARNGETIPIGRHPMLDLWARPNKFYGRRQMEKAIGLSLKVDGNAYIWKVRNRGGEVVELWWVPHFVCFPTWPPDGSEFIDGYMVWVDTVRYWIPRTEIIHVRDGIDPRNQRLGLAALRANLRETVTINYESSYTASILKNAGVPSVVIAPDNDRLRPSLTDAERIKERFLDNFGIDNDNAGAPCVLAGQYKVTQLGFSPEQMTLSILPQNAMARVAGSIGVALMSVGQNDPGKTYSNLSEANRTSWGTIVAIQEIIGEELRWDLLPEFGLDPHNYIIEYDYTHIQELQEPLDALHARTRDDWRAGLCKLNEARELLGYEEDPDGDRYFPGTDPSQTPAGADGGGLDVPDLGVPSLGAGGVKTNGVAELRQLPFPN